MNKLIIVGIIVAIALGITSLYLQIGGDVFSVVTQTFNPCLGYYDTFANELMEHGVFQSDSTPEQNRAFQNFVNEDCFYTITLWMPETPDRQIDKEFVWNLKWSWENRR